MLLISLLSLPACRFNELSRESPGESVKNSLLRAALFDITFLMVVYMAQEREKRQRNFTKIKLPLLTFFQNQRNIRGLTFFDHTY